MRHQGALALGASGWLARVVPLVFAGPPGAAAPPGGGVPVCGTRHGLAPEPVVGGQLGFSGYLVDVAP